MKNHKLILRRAVVMGASAGLAALLVITYRGKFRSDFVTYRLPVLPSANSADDVPAAERDFAAHPDSTFSQIGLAKAYLRLFRKTGQASLLNHASELATPLIAQSGRIPGAEQAEVLLAEIAANQHRFSESIERARRALTQKPSVAAHSLLVTSLLATGSLGDASAAADVFVNQRPGLESYLLRALTLSAQGRDAEAEYDFRRAIALEDIGEIEESARARALFARHCLKRGDRGLAERLLKESLRILPDSALALDLMADVAFRSGDSASAATHAYRAFKQSSQTVYLVHFARLKSLAGNLAEARQAWAQAEELLKSDLSTGNVGHRLELAKLYLDRANEEDLPRAVELAAAEVALRPTAETFQVLGRAWGARGDWRNARTALRRALAQGVRDPELYFWVARAEKRLGNEPSSTLYAELAQSIDDKFESNDRVAITRERPEGLAAYQP